METPFYPEWEPVLVSVEVLLGYNFENRTLLLQALTHSSFSNETSVNGASPLNDNERLEFLGDAVIGLVVAKTLMELFPDASEGKLSRWRSGLVSRKTLAELSAELQLGEYLLLGRGERRTGGAEKRSILAAGLEALVGALYLDSGIEQVCTFLVRVYEPWLKALSDGDENIVRTMDKKTLLQERTQSLYKAAPLYRLVESWGPEHEKYFRVEILIDGKVIARGDGRSKKDAEQHAASVAIEILGF